MASEYQITFGPCRLEAPGRLWYGRPYQYAKVRGLRVVGTPDLVVVLYDRQDVTLQEAWTTLRSLWGVSSRIREAAGALLEGIARARGEV